MNREFEDLDEEERAILNTYAKRVQSIFKNDLDENFENKFWLKRRRMWSCIQILEENKYGYSSFKKNSNVREGLYYID